MEMFFATSWLGLEVYGHPFERDPEMVLKDVLNEKVSLEGAARDYGVAIDAESMEVNQDKTARLRASMSKEI